MQADRARLPGGLQARGDLLNFEDDTDDETGGQDEEPADGTWGGIPMESSEIDVPEQNFDWN